MFAKGQNGSMLEVVCRQDSRLDLVATEDDRQGLGLLGIGEIVDHPGATEGGFIEKAQGTHGLDEDALGDLLVEQQELVGADVLGAEAIGRRVEVFSKLGDRAQRGVDSRSNRTNERKVS